jgi:hypothetical protein
MSSITFHGGRTPDGRPAGKPRTGRMSSRDPVTVARAAKQLVWSGHWRTQIANDDQTKILMSLKARMPWALGLVHPDALVAIAREVTGGTCHWDALLLVRGPGKPELERSEANRVLLGEGCQRCRTRWAAALGVVDLLLMAHIVRREFAPASAADEEEAPCSASPLRPAGRRLGRAGRIIPSGGCRSGAQPLRSRTRLRTLTGGQERWRPPNGEPIPNSRRTCWSSSGSAATWPR